MRTTPESQPLRLPPGAVWSAPSTLKVAGRKNVAGVVCGTEAVAAFAGVAAAVVAAARVAGPAGSESETVARVAATARAAEMAPTRIIRRGFRVVVELSYMGCGLTVVGEVASWRGCRGAGATAAPSARAPNPIDVTGVTPAVRGYTNHPLRPGFPNAARPPCVGRLAR